MIRLQILSDLHFEFYKDGGEGFVRSLDANDVDILVVAGDLSNSMGLPSAIRFLRRKFDRILYVVGNHEYYGAGKEGTEHRIRAHDELYKKSDLGEFHWLHNSVFTFMGRRFLGTPLWFRRSSVPLHHLNDVRQIQDFSKWVYEENQRSREFLHREVRAGDIVITHHLPANECIAPKYVGDPLNAFFVDPHGLFIKEREPQLWIHGHTHESVDVMVGKTRIVCNPFGYHRLEENASFQKRLIVEIEEWT